MPPVHHIGRPAINHANGVDRCPEVVGLSRVPQQPGSITQYFRARGMISLRFAQEYCSLRPKGRRPGA